MLTVERLRPFRGHPTVDKWFRLPVELEPLAKKLAKEDEQTFSRWVAGLVIQEIKTRLKVEVARVPTIWDDDLHGNSDGDS